MNIYRMDEERGWAEYERMNELMNIYRMDEGRLSMKGWMNCLEEVLGWILEAEEHLLSLHNLGHRSVLNLKF